jgi:hypothetical protein
LRALARQLSPRALARRLSLRALARQLSPRALARRLNLRRFVTWESALVLALTTFAAVLRTWDLTDTPFGFIGDEANVVRDSQRIAKDGWVGPWSGTALGYPIAALYVIAPFIKVLGVSVFSARLPAALLGTVAVPLAYYVGRNVGGWRVGLCSALLLTVSIWHLHVSRVALPVVGWPTMELAALLCLQLGIRDRNPVYFVLCGLATGVSLWVYPSASAFAVALSAFLGVWGLVQIYRARSLQRLELAALVPLAIAGAYVLGRRQLDLAIDGWVDPFAYVLVFAIAPPLLLWMFWRLLQRQEYATVQTAVLLILFAASAYLAAKPLIDFSNLPSRPLDNRFKIVYIFDGELRRRCEEAPPEQHDYSCRNAVARSTSHKLDVVRNRLQFIYQSLVNDSVIDGADGLGGLPPIGKYVAYLAAVGIVLSLARFRRDAVIIGLMVIPALALASALTRGGELRRCIGMLPFVTLYAAITMGVAWEWASRQRLVIHAAVFALVAVTIGVAGYQHVEYYFRDYEKEPSARFVFNPDAREMFEYVDSLGHPYVYFYNNRISVGYETSVLAPNMAGGEDRATQFVQPEEGDMPRIDLRPAETVAVPARQRPDGAVFVLDGAYAPLLDAIERRYPGGKVTSNYDERLGNYIFIGYHLPERLLREFMAQESFTYPVALPPAP